MLSRHVFVSSFWNILFSTTCLIWLAAKASFHPLERSEHSFFFTFSEWFWQIVSFKIYLSIFWSAAASLGIPSILVLCSFLCHQHLLVTGLWACPLCIGLVYHVWSYGSPVTPGLWELPEFSCWMGRQKPCFAVLLGNQTRRCWKTESQDLVSTYVW